MKAREIASLVALAAIAALPLTVKAQPVDQPPAVDRGDRWDASHVSGVIATIQGSSIQLDNGRVIFLHHKTVINPTGTKLQDGMWIAVLGSPSSRDAIDANEIDVGPGPGMTESARYHGTFAAGTIASIQGSSLQLDTGRVVFLHRGTVIAPTGTTLAAGMRIRVLGSPSANGDAIDANAIQVAGTGARGM